MWLIVGPLEVLFFVRLVGWPLDLALLILVPILVVWIPFSYRLAIAGNDRHRRGEEAAPYTEFARFGLLGVLTGVLSTLSVFGAAMLRAESLVGTLVVLSIAIPCLWAAVLIARRSLTELRQPDNCAGRAV